MRRRNFLLAVEGVEGDRAAYDSDALWRAAAAADPVGVSKLEVLVQKLAYGGQLQQLNQHVRRAERPEPEPAVSFVSRVIHECSAVYHSLHLPRELRHQLPPSAWALRVTSAN